MGEGVGDGVEVRDEVAAQAEVFQQLERGGGGGGDGAVAGLLFTHPQLH